MLFYVFSHFLIFPISIVWGLVLGSYSDTAKQEVLLKSPAVFNFCDVNSVIVWVIGTNKKDDIEQAI